MKNQHALHTVALIALVLLIGTESGCATLCGVSDECTCENDTCCGCGDCVGSCCDIDCVAENSPGNCRCSGCLGTAHGQLACWRHRMRIPVGPPAVRYQPEMPPEFLPLPVTPVIANVNPNAPTEMRGGVEVGWAPPCQLTITGRD